VSAIALATALSPLATGPSLAACSNNNPPDGAVVVCSGEDTAGVRNAAGVGVTVDMSQSGSAIRPTDGNVGIRLGDGAKITTGAGTDIATQDYGIVVLNDANLHIDGDIVSSGKGRAAIRAGDRLALLVGENATLSNDGTAALGVEAGDDATIVLDGTIRLSPASPSGGQIGGGAGIAAGDRARVFVSSTGLIEVYADGVSGITARRDSVIEVDGTIVTRGGQQNLGFSYFANGAQASQGSTITVSSSGRVTTSGTRAAGLSLAGSVDRYSSNRLGTIDVSGEVSVSGAAASAVSLSAAADRFGIGPVGVNPQATVIVRDRALLTSNQFIAIYEQPSDDDYRAIDTTVRVAGEILSRDDLPAIYLAGGNDEVTLEPTAIIPNSIVVGRLDDEGSTTNDPDEIDTLILDGEAGTEGSYSLQLEDGTEALYGFDRFRKTGDGDWFIEGGDDSTFAAAGTVEAGRLFVDKAVPGLQLHVLGDALLSGSGTVGSISADAGSMVAPRASGLASSGTVVLAPGATLAIYSDGDGNIAYLDSAGLASIGGAALDIDIDTADLAAAKGAAVVTAGGGVDGRFGVVRDAIPDIDVVAVYAPNVVSLDYRLAAPGSMVTDKSIHSETMSAFLESELGFVASLANRAGGADGTTPTAAIVAPLAYGPDARNPGRSLGQTGRPARSGLVAWLDGLAGGLSVDGAGLSGFDLEGGGFVGGLEHRDEFGGGALAMGVAAGYGENHVDTETASAEGRTGRFGAYVDWDNDVWSLSAAGSVGIARIETVRNLGFATATSDADATLASAALRASYNLAARMGLPESAVVAPYATLDLSHIRRGAFAEQGAGLLGLSAPAEEATRGLGGVGMTFANTFETGAGWAVTPTVSFGYQRVFGDRSVETELAFALVDATFQQSSTAVARDRFKLGAGLTAEFGEALSVSANYNGAIGSGYRSHSGSLGLSWRF
jgi:outer membrane autotransporter protein